MKRGYAAQFGERFTRLRRAKITILVPPHRKRYLRQGGFPLRFNNLGSISELLLRPSRLWHRTFALNFEL